MKKTFIAAALLVVFGSSFACGHNQSCNVPSSSGSTTVTAGSSTQTGASAASSGNGSAFSFNAATSGASAVGGNLQTVGNSGSLSFGAATVGGSATTTGSLLSVSGSTGNAAAGGFSFATACAEVLSSAKYAVLGKDPVAGSASGDAKSQTGGLAQTSADVGGGFAIAGGVAGSTATFGATAGSTRIGALVNIASSTAGVKSTSYQLGGNANVGNATSSIEGWDFSNSDAASNASAGNLCTATSCVNAKVSNP